MGLPAPQPGLVFRYDYVWAGDADAGSQSGKDRPACLVAASDSSLRPKFVVILPITHSKPGRDTVSVELPPKVKAHLGLDDLPSWVIVSEHNVDAWPNGGLSALSGRPGAFSHGFLPPSLFAQIKASFLKLALDGRTKGVKR